MTRVNQSANRYPARIILRSAIRLALATYPTGSTGAAATIVQSIAPTLRNPNLSTIAVSDLRRNLEALLSPRLKVGACKFSKLAPLKLLAVSERRGVVSEPGRSHAKLLTVDLRGKQGTSRREDWNLARGRDQRRGCVCVSGPGPSPQPRRSPRRPASPKGGGNDRNLGLEVDRHRRGRDGRA